MQRQVTGISLAVLLLCGIVLFSLRPYQATLDIRPPLPQQQQQQPAVLLAPSQPQAKDEQAWEPRPKQQQAKHPGQPQGAEQHLAAVPRARPSRYEQRQPPASRTSADNTHELMAAARGADPRNEPGWAEWLDRQCSVDFAAVIKLQLAPFQVAGITQSMLDNIYCVRKQVVRVSLRHGRLRQQNWQLTMDHHRLKSAFWLLKLAAERALARGQPLPPVEFVANPTDKTSKFAKGFSQRAVPHMPLFCNAKCAGDDSISFPFMFFSQFGSPDGDMGLALYQARHRQLSLMGSPTPWANKTRKLFFSATNVRGHRQALLETDHPNMELLAANVELAKYGHYQYLAYTYGHSGWSRRLRELALFDTVVLMENSTCHEFFAHVFQPDVHFLPVAEDLSDLAAQLARAMQKPAASENMARRWRELGHQTMSLECVLDYVEGVLRGYAKLQRFEPLPRHDWAEFHFGANIDYFMDAVPPDVAVCRPYF